MKRWRFIRSLVGTTLAFALAGGRALSQQAGALPEHINGEAQRAIVRGLQYLGETQNPTGSWFNAGNMGSYPTAMTALAGLALLANGSTPREGKFAPHLKRAVQLLLAEAEAGPTGLISSNLEGRSMHGHGFAMLFLAECLGETSDEKNETRLRAALHRAVELTARAQSPAGGWIYTPDGNGDEGSVTVTQIQGLRACRNAGIKVPRTTIERAVKYLELCQNADGGIGYSLAQRGGSRPPISAAAVATLYASGRYDSTMTKKCLDYAIRTVTPNGRETYGHWFYAHLYMSQAMYQVHDKRWDSYFVALRDRLLGTQNADGSWNGDGVGPVYGTAIACIALQLPYDYVPIFQR
ncbi:MAG: terpene cyclase/mutase family protein [Verrucomicrobia bacterium]|nr:terpene cyclase/mutase family protein [Verrucomicrobiota bacterium]